MQISSNGSAWGEMLDRTDVKYDYFYILLLTLKQKFLQDGMTELSSRKILQMYWDNVLAYSNEIRWVTV